ncbi:MAG: copper resistance protein CopC [Thermomicrobiales bacterium]
MRDFRGRWSIPPFTVPPLRALIIVVLMLVVSVFATPAGVDAHAAYKSSDPANGAIVSTVPTAITATFTERLEPTESWLQLYDSTGAEVEGTTLSFGSDEYTMTLAVPSGLPKGTYSVLWRTLSNDDGHTANGYFTFTVGTAADVSSVVTIPTLKTGQAAPQILQTASRWAALAGLAAFIAVWPMWVLIVRPALTPIWRDGPRLTRRMKRYTQVAFLLAVLGSVFALLVQAMSLTQGTFFDKVMNTLGQTRYGSLWLTRVGLFAALGLMLSACAWWFLRQRRFEHIGAWVLTLALPIPFSLNAHASAQPAGRTTAIVADYAHLLSAGVWVGGIAILATVLLPAMRWLDPQERRQVLVTAIPRFSLLAIIAWLTLGLTGFYAGWLQVGNLNALTTTPYGRSLMVKLALLVVVLAIAAVNLLLIERHLRRKLDDGQAMLWSRRLTWTVTAELILVIGVLGAVGQMTSQEPARDVVVTRSQQIEVTYKDANPPSTLLIAPGVAGVNHFRLEVNVPDGQSLPTDTTALLRLSLPENPGLGTKQIALSRVAGNAFEYHGSDLGITGNWQIEMILREPNTDQIEATQTVTIAATPSQEDVPGTPWRFETTGGVSGLILLLAGLGALTFAVMEARGRLRKETAGLGVAAIALGIVLLLQARIDPILAVSAAQGAIDAKDVAMVERGSDVYTTYCLSCHGADLRGDGPASTGMTPPPADFSQPHTMVHSDDDLVYWITNGKQGTAMPGFRNDLSDQQIRDVLAFIQNRQQSFGETGTTLGPEQCTVAPRTIGDLEALVGTASGGGASGRSSARADAAPLQIASDPSVPSEVESAILQTTEQMIACTNGVDTLKRLALFSDANLKAAFPNGVSTDFATMAAGAPTPLPETQWVSLVSIQDVAMVSDGRVSATVVLDDPSAQLAGTSGVVSTPDAGTQRATLVFVQAGDRWLIDEIRQG